jgi:ubiquinone/menaquinone biosynthesis C-methylase UbiE
MASRGIRAQLLQTDEEWDTRNAVLSRHLADLIEEYSARGGTDGIEVGCQHGALTEQLRELTHVSNWAGIDPTLTEQTVTDSGCVLLPGRASQIGFRDKAFDVAVFANVFEHIPPAERDASLREIYRVLKPGGVVVGQLPNPYFPIESHSRLPFMGWLPVKWQHRYWRLAPVSWGHDFYVVTIKHLKQSAQQAGFDVVHVRNFNYPPEAIPKGVRWAARLLERPMRYLPWSWQFVLARPR